jgi:transcription elongation factor Elf1
MNETKTQQALFLEREPVEGTCPRCGDESLRRYPVNSEGGWFMVVKCQQCLLSVNRERWSRLGPIELLSDAL